MAGPYLATLAIPIFALSILAVAFVLLAWLKDRRRFAEAFESIFEARPGEERLRRALWATARGAALGRGPAVREASWASATWPCSPRTSASRGFAS